MPSRPAAFRPSTLSERKKFYSRFSPAVARKWLAPKYRNWIIAIDVGGETRICKPGLGKLRKSMLYFARPEWKKLKGIFLRHLPEDVYYSRNRFMVPREEDVLHPRRWFKSKNFQGQELVFDIDADNFECMQCNGKKVLVCRNCLESARLEALALWETLEGAFGFREMRAAYSGKGFHLHVMDEKAFRLSPKERQKITRALLQNGYHIDEWVSNGNIDLVRLPSSLNGLVNRKVVGLREAQLKRFRARQRSRAR